jgi:7-cyano-7-deazaguanine synthase
MKKNKKHVVISLSGGMDSSTLLLRCLKEYDTCTAISFDYGQKHRVELERAQSLVDYINEKRKKQIALNLLHLTAELDMDVSYSPITYRQIQLNGLVDLLDSALVTGGDDVPEGHYAEENMKATVVPNRNKIFASIVQAVALSVANKTGETCDIAMGIHAGDHAIYPDCRQEFRDADDHAFRMGNWDAERVGYFTPYLEGDKFTILQDGEVLCSELGLDFNEVYRRTNTSYKPIFHNLAFVNNEDEIVDCSDWFSDYKSASSVERVEAFIKLGRPDPIPYANEEGPVSWDFVVEQVTKVLKEHNK